MRSRRWLGRRGVRPIAWRLRATPWKTYGTELRPGGGLTCSFSPEASPWVSTIWSRLCLQKQVPSFFFTGVRMQPGKPVVFGRLPANASSSECYFFGLPGNPISAQVTFQCFAEVFLRVAGGEDTQGPRWAQATLGRAIASKPGLTRLLPARMNAVTVEPVVWQGSGDLAANARANCFAELLPGRSYDAGEVIRVLLR